MTEKKNSTAEAARKWLEAETKIANEIARRAPDLSDSQREDAVFSALKRWNADRDAGRSVKALASYAAWAVKDATRLDTTTGVRKHRRNVADTGATERAGAHGDPGDALATLIDARPRPIPAAAVSLRLTDGRAFTADEWAAEIAPEQLRSDLASLAQRWQMAANKQPDDDKIGDMAAVLLALADPGYDELPMLAGKVRRWQKDSNRVPGAGTREMQEAMFLRYVSQRDPSLIVRRLRVLPSLASMTTLPWRAPLDSVDWLPFEEAAGKALLASMGEPPLNQAKAVLRALGATQRAVKGLGEAARKRRERADK